AVARVSGPVERVMLERSFHVATLDYDRDLIVERVVEFALRVTPAPRRFQEAVERGTSLPPGEFLPSSDAAGVPPRRAALA
ncbi:MAG: hypothetical protein ACRD0O_15895, partial [Acidimicrobiia bacterium]